GAGVRLRRAFGFGATADYDPFLLLDDFRNERPQDYLAGFPWHPHRGIETITYVLAGAVEHRDSMGNRGSIGAGDVQWMTAVRGRGQVLQRLGAAGGTDRARGLGGRETALTSGQPHPGPLRSRRRDTDPIRRRRHPLPPHLRPAARRARRVVWARRHEYARGA